MGLDLILNRACVVAFACVGATTIVVGASIARRDLDDLGVVRDGIVDIARQSVRNGAVVIGRGVVGSPLDDFRAALDSQLRLLALETILLVARQYRRSC